MLEDLIFKLKVKLGSLLNLSTTYPIGNFELKLPAYHTLPGFQRKNKMYDKQIGAIAKVVAKHKPDSFVLDIGANVGDTAAEIRSATALPIVCIEGNEAFLAYLRPNAAKVGGCTLIEQFVGTDADDDQSYKVVNYGGTAKVVETKESDVKVHSLEVLLEQAKLDKSKLSLFKTDTDGFDFRILNANLRLINEIKPVIFTEYDFTFNKPDETEAIALISKLTDIGYHYLVYDNFGNFMQSIKANHLEAFEHLHLYLKSNKRYGGGLFYYDVLAVHERDKAIFEELIAEHKSKILK